MRTGTLCGTAQGRRVMLKDKDGALKVLYFCWSRTDLIKLKRSEDMRDNRTGQGTMLPSLTGPQVILASPAERGDAAAALRGFD